MESSEQKAFLIKSVHTGTLELKLRLTNETDGSIYILMLFQEVVLTVPCVIIEDLFSLLFPHLWYNNSDYKSSRMLKIQSWELQTVTECLILSLVVGLLGVIIHISNYTFILAAGFNYTLQY